MNDISVAYVNFGIRIIKIKNYVILCQSHYARKIVKKIGMLDCTFILMRAL